MCTWIAPLKTVATTSHHISVHTIHTCKHYARLLNVKQNKKKKTQKTGFCMIT